MGWAKGAAAVLWAGLGGQAGAEAIVRILQGKVNPSGKLAETWWERYEDCPTSDPSLFPGGEDVTQYRERLFVGYRGVGDKKPRYPFGHGLSYTKFAYSNLRVSPSGVRLQLKNVGTVAGGEVVFAFYSKKEAVIVGPARQLCAFKKVFLEAGEEREIELPFDNRAFAYYDVEQKAWRTEAGAYEVEVGASYGDIRLAATLALAGEEVTAEKTVEFAAAIEAPKKRGMTVHENTTVDDLRYAKGWAGRFFAWAIRRVIGFCAFFGNKEQANTLVMGVVHQTMRGLAKCGGMSRNQLDGLLLMFNGKFFKGLKTLLRKDKRTD
jgi:beta-glucosidase